MKFRTLIAIALILLPLTASAQTATSNSCPNLTRTLSRGMRNTEVVALQKFLVSNKLLLPDAATGFYGLLTQRAVQTYQRSQNLEAVGFVGARTRAALRTCNKIGVIKPIGAAPPTGIVVPPTNGGGGGNGGGGTPSTPGYSMCSFGNQTIQHGSTVTAYKSLTVPNVQACTPEQRTCTDGSLSGSFQFASCSAQDAITVIYQVSPNGSPYSLKSALEILKTADAGAQDVIIKLADGTYDMSAHSNDSCGGIQCITFTGIPNPSRISIIGNTAHPENVVLHFAKPSNSTQFWPGGFYLFEQKEYGMFDGFTMEGPYNGWTDRGSRTPDQTPFPSSSNIKFTTMGVWARNGARVTIGPNVRIKGFYFGIASEGVETVVHADHVKVEQCGDAGFIAWTGGTLYANDSEASWCAAYGWGLGAGYVSETASPQGIASYSDSDPLTDDAAIRTYTYDYSKGVRASVEIPLLSYVTSEINRYGGRSKLFSDRAWSHDNLVAGYIANVGGQIQMNNALAFRNGLSSVPVSGPTLSGGVVAQINGSVQANDSIAYHNGKYGFASLLASDIRAVNSKVFGNVWHGFYALEQGSKITASGASSFSFGAQQMFGYGAERTAIIVVSSTTKAGVNAGSFSFFDPLTNSMLSVVAEKNTQWDYSPAIGATGNEGGTIVQP